MAKRVAIVQSNYIPWKGDFDLIASVDEFILLDDVQYTRQNWRNRNRVKTPQGPLWLTIPIHNRFGQRIDEVLVSDSSWPEKHWRTIELNYARSDSFSELSMHIERLYLEV